LAAIPLAAQYRDKPDHYFEATNSRAAMDQAAGERNTSGIAKSVIACNDSQAFAH
jgi:hypothetical protein